MWWLFDFNPSRRMLFIHLVITNQNFVLHLVKSRLASKHVFLFGLIEFRFP